MYSCLKIVIVDATLNPLKVARLDGSRLRDEVSYMYSPFHKKCPIWGPAVGDQWW